MAKIIFITGTNSGFGRMTALALASHGHRVFATMRDVGGRNKAAADELTGAGIHVIEMELTSQASVDAAVKKATDTAGPIDVVINNAGYAAFGLEETLTDEQVLRQLDVNLVGPHRVLRAVLPAMRARKAGVLISVSSGLGRFVLPCMGAYCASKAGLESLLDTYRYELKPLGIESTIVQPGAFPTDFVSRLDGGNDAARAQSYGPNAGMAEQLGASFGAMLSGPDAPNPQMVVDAIVKLVDAEPGTRPDRVVVDAMAPQAIEGLNHGHREVQRAILTGVGMAKLVD